MVTSFPVCERMLSCFSHVQLFATLWTVAFQASLSMGFSRQEFWSGLPCPSPGDLPNLEIEPRSPALQADALTSEPQRKPWHFHCWWECKLIQPLWRTVCRFLKKLEIKLPHDPTIPLLGIYPEETITEKDTRSFSQCSLQHYLQ